MAKKDESFSKILQIGDESSDSDSTRALPLDFVRRFSDDELLGRRMKISTKWGATWKIEICKNPGFFFMDKVDWNRFLRENCLKGGELLTFTHKGAMCFTVSIFREVLQPPRSTTTSIAYSTSLASSSKKKKKDSAGPRFSIVMKKSYLTHLAIKHSFAKDHMPTKNTTFKIHHPDRNKSWEVVYLPRKDSSTEYWNPCFSAGWSVLAKEYPLVIGDTCKFTLIQPGELLLVVTKPGEKDDGCEVIYVG